MHNLRLRAAILLYAPLALLLAACGTSLSQPTAIVTPTAVPGLPSPVPTLAVEASATPGVVLTASPVAGINITRADFDRANVLWTSANVQEYEMEVEFSAFSMLRGVWTLHVTSDVATVIGFSQGGTPVPSPQVQPDDVNSFTVVRQFKEILTALQNPGGEWNSSVDYFVTFDPKLGYPAVFEKRDKPNIADAGSTLTVKSLKITKQGTPVMENTPGSTATPAAGVGPINITYKDYEAALTKWRASGTIEYEMDIEVGFLEVPEVVPSGRYVVRVSVGEQNVEVLQAPQLPDGTEYTLRPGDSAAMRYLTVAGQFENVAELLTRTSQVGTTRLVTFDPALGYPASVEDGYKSTGDTVFPGGSGGTTVQIHSVKVLNRGTPGPVSPPLPSHIPTP